ATFGKMIHALMHEIKNPLAVIEQALQRYSSADEADADALKSAASEPASSYPQMGAYAQPEQVAQSNSAQPDAQLRDDVRGGGRSDAQARDDARRGAQSGAQAGVPADAQSGVQTGTQAKTPNEIGTNRQDWNNEFIPLLIRQIGRMVAIVHSTRNLLPNRSPEQDNIDVLAHLREVIEDLGQLQRDDGSAICFDLDTSALATLTVHFDPTHLSQIISNLIRNSIDHAQVDPGELHINMTGRNAGGFIELEYWDNGTGIDAHKREHLWKAFYSSDHEHAGLGLHISNELCQINGATFEYISLAVPARFRLSLPNAH
nr:HAMP domain-containing histidine kinase [Pseudomonadota bacterium]